MHILSPVTDNCSSWISGRGRMAVEMFSWPSLHERMCRTWGSNSGPLACQANRCMNIIIWDYESVWRDAWPQIKYRSPWPIFHGQVILCYILWIMCHYDRTFWPQNKGMSLWPIFHGPLILPYISKTIWWMSVIYLDNETVWHKRWPQNKFRSSWPIFHGLVILLNIFKIIW